MRQTGYIIPERLRQRMEAIKARAPLLRAKAKEQAEFRKTDAYIQAMELLSKELGSEEPIPEISLQISPDALNELQQDDGD